MERFSFEQQWLRDLLPEGMLYPSSTLISGPGGSGKPLIGFLIAGEWLKKGGGIVFLLTSTTREYLEKSMEIMGMPLDPHRKRVVFVETDPHATQVEKISQDMWKANLVNPEHWDPALKEAVDAISSQSKDIMVVGSALNLFFFSNTYRQAIKEKLEGLIANPGEHTLVFTVNSDAFKDLVEDLEARADNLMFSRMEEPMKLFLRVERMKDVPFKREEVEVPLSRDVLMSIKQEAEKGKKGLIPLIKKL